MKKWPASEAQFKFVRYSEVLRHLFQVLQHFFDEKSEDRSNKKDLSTKKEYGKEAIFKA